MIIMMKKYTEQKEDDKIRRMISPTKMKAPENLKHRIMHQIEYEKALTPEKNLSGKSSRKENGNILRDMGSIFGTMYAIIAIMAIVAYLLQGAMFYQSIEFWGAVIFVAFVFSFFWLISRLDIHLKQKRNNKYLSDVLSKSTEDSHK